MSGRLFQNQGSQLLRNLRALSPFTNVNFAQVLKASGLFLKKNL